MNTLLGITERHPLRRVGVGVLLTSVLGFAGYGLGVILPGLLAPPLRSAVADFGCDLHQGACNASFDQQRQIRLELSPKSITPSTPIRMTVNTPGIAATRVDVEFSGVNMNMGTIESELLSFDDGSFVGDSVLPVCVRRQMTWQAEVTVRGDDAVYRGLFTFDVNKR